MQKANKSEVRGSSVLYSDNKGEVKPKLSLVKDSKYLIPSLNGNRVMTITEVDYDRGMAKAEDDNMIAWLEYAADFRGIWTAMLTGDKRSRAKVIFA